VAEGTVREQAARLAATRLTEFWDATVITEAHGAAALDRDLFACALACLDLTAEETVFVGAGPAAGFAAARQVGLAAFWIGETGLRPPPHTTVHVGGLGELADALDLMEGRRAAS
jgi:FMN phosphatase YigB (HAD superfamily)